MPDIDIDFSVRDARRGAHLPMSRDKYGKGVVAQIVRSAQMLAEQRHERPARGGGSLAGAGAVWPS